MCSAVDIQDLTFVTAAAAGIGSYAAAVTANKKREKSSAAASSSSSAAAGKSSSVETSTIQITKKKSRGPAVAESLARGRGGGKGIVGDTRNELTSHIIFNLRKQFNETNISSPSGLDLLTRAPTRRANTRPNGRLPTPGTHSSASGTKIASGTTPKTSASILTLREIWPCLTNRRVSLQLLFTKRQKGN